MPDQSQPKKGVFQNLKEIIYGMAAHDMSRYAIRTRASMEHLFSLITMGDMLGQGPVEIKENLWAQEIDADTHIKAYQNEVRQKILDMYGFDKVPDEIEQYIQAASAEPAMEESAIFDAVVDIVVKGDFDCY